MVTTRIVLFRSSGLKRCGRRLADLLPFHHQHPVASATPKFSCKRPSETQEAASTCDECGTAEGPRLTGEAKTARMKRAARDITPLAAKGIPP